MTRSISAISAGASAASGDYALYLSTAELEGSSKDYSTDDIGLGYLPVIIDPSMAIGPELDWRGGLGSWSSITVQLVQGFDSSTGTATDNTFEFAKTLPTWDQIPSTDRFVQHILNRNEQVNLFIAAKTTGSSWASNAVRIYSGYVRNVSQSDFGPLTLEIGPRREQYLQSTFLRRLGLESADANYDDRTAVNQPNPFNEDARGDAVPLLYGALNHAECVAPHLTPTDDSSTGAGGRHGLILCFSDVLYDCDLSVEAELYTPGSQAADPLVIERADYNGDVQYRNIKASGTSVDYIGTASNLRGQGCFVGFTDDTTLSGNGMAGNGYLVISRQVVLDKVATRGSSPGTFELDQDDTNYAETTQASAGSPIGFDMYAVPDEEFGREFYVVFLRCKVRSTAGDVVTPNLMRASALRYASSWQQGRDVGSEPGSVTLFDNWRGVDSEIGIGFTADTAAGFSTSGSGLSFNWQLLSVVSAGTTWRLYGGIADLWYNIPWAQYWNRIYGTVRGIYDVSYDNASATYLEHPAEQFAHLYAAVVGGPVDTVAWQGAATEQNADSIVTDFQLTDAEETAEDVLEKLATQSMSWIVPNDMGEEEYIYRLGVEGDDTQAQAPFNRSNIIKGSFNWGMTPREDLYRGCIVNYAYSALEGRYREQAIIAPTSSDYVTNVGTSPGGITQAEYTAFVDDIAATEIAPLIVNADYIQDETAAEQYCRWLTLLHGRRRQMIEFDTFLEFASITPGDLIYVDMPQVRAYASGDQLSVDSISLGFVTLSSNATTYSPSGDTTDKGFGAAHDQDLLVIESGSDAGSHRLQWASGSSAFLVDDPTTLSVGTIAEPWRILPGFDVLSAQIVYDAQNGPRLHIKAVEHPVLLPQATGL